MKSSAVSETYEVNSNPSHGMLVLAKARKDPALEINDLLQIQIPDDSNSLSYRSRVDDIVWGRIQIAWPTDRGVYVPIHRNQTLTISFVRDDAVYAFSGIVEEMTREPLAQLSIATLGAPDRIQRRQFFRVKSFLPVEFLGEQLNFDDQDLAPNVIALKTQTYEISGSGMAIRHNCSIPAGTLLDCRLTLAAERTRLKILCKVVHSSRIGANTDASLYHIGMFFLSIKEADRTRIVRHVFRVELG